MSAREIDDYLAGVGEPHRSTLEALRRTILDIVPEAEEGLSYGAPVFRIDGRAVAGFVAAKAHLSYLPHSGAVLEALAGVVGGYATSKGALRFAIDEPLPRALVERLIAARRSELA